MKCKKYQILIIGLILLGDSCGATQLDLEKAMALDNFNEVENSQPEFEELKLWGVRMGMYYGYQSEINIINEELKENAHLLDKAYNFRNLIIEDNLLPPVIIKGYNFYERDSAVTTESSEIYRIRKKATYSYNSPTWRNYLVFDSSEFKKPVLNSGLKPKSKEAESAWEKSVLKGYNQGVEHARELIAYKLSELNEDFKGMMLAHHLFKLNMLDMSRLIKSEKGTVVSEDAININEVVTQLDGKDAFKPLEDWKPLIRVHEKDGD